MLRQFFFHDLFEKVAEGREYFASGLKAMVGTMNKKTFDLLDQDSTDIFLHPMLFSYLNADTTQINCDQILYGSIKEADRPQSIAVMANDFGEIYMPGIGYLETGIPHKEHYILVTTKNEMKILKDKKVIPYRIKRNPVIAGTNIELQCRSNYLTDIHLPGKNLYAGNYKNAKAINEAVSILKKYYPEFFSLFTAVTKYIVPFNHPGANSFALLGMHGTAFINTHLGKGVVFFLEDIVHQCGHIIFSTITYKPADYFNVDPQTPISGITNDGNDDRTLYVLFHGIFTEALMCEAFDICIENKVFKPGEDHELRGRLCYILLRFIMDMQIMGSIKCFSEKGQVIYDEIYKSMASMYKKYGAMLKTFNLENQPYNFDFSKFRKINPQYRESCL
ncbi:MAG: hypothetical protein QM737_05150 [Ferruginibacter sp.]